MSIEALYTHSNCSAAYQLNWSLSVFGQEPIAHGALDLETLNAELAHDNLKVFELNLCSENVAQFFISSRPESKPSEIVRRVKGRWVWLSKTTTPVQLRRNYHLTSVGTVNSAVLDAYVARQPERHAMADPRVQSMIEALQFRDSSIDLTRPRRNHYGHAIIAYHVVVETVGNWHNLCERSLKSYRAAVLAAGRKHGWRIARIGLVSNHIHVLLGADIQDVPADIALSILNNLAYTHDMKPVFKFSYYIGSFGKYDRGAIWNSIS